MSGRVHRHQRRPAEPDLVAVAQNPVDGVRLSTRAHPFECRHILGHRHHLRSCQLLDERVSLHVIAMGMTAEHDLDVGELEAQLFHRLAQDRDAFFEVRVDQYVPVGGGHEKRALNLGADEVDIADHFMWRKRTPRLLGRTGRQPRELFRRHVPLTLRQQDKGDDEDAGQRETRESRDAHESLPVGLNGPAGSAIMSGDPQRRQPKSTR